MTQTPKNTAARIAATSALLNEIAADATTYAVAYFAQPPVGGGLGDKWDRQAAQDRSLAAAAALAAAKLGKLQSGTYTYGREQA